MYIQTKLEVQSFNNCVVLETCPSTNDTFFFNQAPLYHISNTISNTVVKYFSSERAFLEQLHQILF